MTDYEPVIGLEVHAELQTRSKMFCGCGLVDSTLAPPNSSVCEICTGMPGTLPVINQRAVEFALRVALALHCSIADRSLFARKNYFYPDLPKGFQISQYELPLASGGWFEFESESGMRRVGIHRVHLEEDTGKLFHREGYSLVDYNRSGVPLLEIVSEPELHSVEDARRYGLALRSLLRYLGVNSGDMQKGVIRFEANVSLRPTGSRELGTRTEIKNLNSFRALARSIGYEIERQQQVLTSGGQVEQATVGWDETREVTLAQRSKEQAHDYRYFPEPDLPPLQIDPGWVEQIRRELPELPAAKRARFVAEYGLSPYTAAVLTEEPEVAGYFETAVQALRSPAGGSPGGAEPAPIAKLANWLSVDLFGLLNQAGLPIGQAQVRPEALAELVALVEAGTISAASGKVVLEELFTNGGDPRSVVQARNLAQLSDTGTIRPVVDRVLAEHPEQVEAYLGGKTALTEWFLGQVMRASGGRADPAVVRAELETALREKSRSAR
jgi:aspartyl-tRNA(Asn)/glutamyl-tRNA(Gln) amidotransferase subunit B